MCLRIKSRAGRFTSWVWCRGFSCWAAAGHSGRRCSHSGGTASLPPSAPPPTARRPNSETKSSWGTTSSLAASFRWLPPGSSPPPVCSTHQLQGNSRSGDASIALRKAFFWKTYTACWYQLPSWTFSQTFSGSWWSRYGRPHEISPSARGPWSWWRPGRAEWRSW